MSAPPTKRAASLKKSLLTGFETDLETGARLSRKKNLIFHRRSDGSSRTTTIEPRWGFEEDRLLLQAIRNAFASGDDVRLTSRTGYPVTDMRRAKRRIRTIIGLEDTEVIIGKESIFYVPHWDHGADRVKALSWAMLIHQVGGHAFTLHLGPEIVSAARASRKGFAVYIRDRISRHLRRTLKPLGLAVPEFCFWVEAAYGIEPHLHGAIEVSDPAHLQIVRRALRAAGGNWNEQTKLRTTLIETPVRWFGYIMKWQLSTAIQIGDQNLVAATEGLRRRAKAWYVEARRSEDLIGTRTIAAMAA